MIESLKSYQGKMANTVRAFVLKINEVSDKDDECVPDGYDDFRKIFKGFMDICETIETIDMLYILVGINPPRSRLVSVDLYLKHLISSYLSEVYILKERLNSYATKISRMYAKVDPTLDVKDDFEQLYASIKKSLEGINNTRNLHVHSERHSDEDLDWLSSLKLVSDTDNSFKDSFDYQYKKLRIKWKKQISDNNEVMVKLLTNYFDVIFKLISVDGEIVLPNKLAVQ
jgi:hypothetical protein